MEEYYGEFRSVVDIFERRISPAFQMTALRRRGPPQYLSDFCPADQQSILLRNLYFKVSAALRSKLRRRLDAGNLHQVRAWFQTADAAVLPLLISEREHTQLLEVECDVLTNWSLENCAHNYALFQGELKALKKRMRKSYALHNDIDHVECPGFMIPYLRACRNAFRRTEFSGPADIGRFILLWCQTRATGMADGSMITASLKKFESTTTDPGTSIVLDPSVLRKVIVPVLNARGTEAKVSCGTTACLERTRGKGGKTAYLSTLSRVNCVRKEYNFRTLEGVDIKPRPVRSSKDLVNWAIYQLLNYPTYTSCVRVHAVSEPSKARTITVAPYAYQVIMGVFAHVFQPALTGRQVRSGLKADRHLWRFLTDVLNPQNKEWENLINDNVYSLSTDLSEATDWGNFSVARQIWHGLITASECEAFPLGLALLAKSKYCRKRFAFVPTSSDCYKLVVTNRGWLMGDMMTKVILTLAHQYCCEKSGLLTYTLVGDDEIALDPSRVVLENHLKTLNTIFKVSELDTFVSDHFAFYCEEGTLVPQRVQDTPHVKMKRGEELQYLDYPRIRLLLPQVVETDAYSMTNIGRFSLLGKESMWVHSVNTPAARHFAQAALLQHMLVPQEPDCICPYTPLEIGGDGAFPHSERFMGRVINDKSRDPRETFFRLSALLNSRFGFKFIRSDRLDKVVTRHHLYLPKIDGLRRLLPSDAILDTSNKNTKILLGSLRHTSIKDPQTVFFDLAKGLYYKALLEGKTPPEPVFNIDRQFTAGHTNEPTVDLGMLIDTWKNPGFKQQESWGYYVDTTKIPHLNPMSLGWDFGEHRRLFPKSRDIFQDWLAENVDLREAALPDILRTIREGHPLPDRVVKRLNLVLESDSYILHVLEREWANNTIIGIVTRDYRLGRLVQRKLSNWNPRISHTVVCLDPAIYMIGRTQEVEDLLRPLGQPKDWSMTWIEDPGAMLYVDYTEFDDGFPLREDVWDCEILHSVSRWEKVHIAKLC